MEDAMYELIQGSSVATIFYIWAPRKMPTPTLATERNPLRPLTRLAAHGAPWAFFRGDHIDYAGMRA
jgi:hypothetical protein